MAQLLRNSKRGKKTRRNGLAFDSGKWENLARKKYKERPLSAHPLQGTNEKRVS